MLKRIAASIAVAALILGGFYAGGYNFTRGESGFYCYLFTVGGFICMYFAPWWHWQD